MKNIVKMFGIITFVAIIGFSMTGCGEYASWTLEVVNSSSYDLTVYIKIHYKNWERKIAKGQSDSVTYRAFGDPPDIYDFIVSYWPTDNTDRIKSKQGYIAPHSTETFTINDGDIPLP